MKKCTAFALALILTLTLCACGGAKDNEAILGTYTLYAMDYDEKSIVLASDLFSGKNYITLKSGGTAEMCLEDDVASVRWKAEGDKLTVTADDGDMTGRVSDGLLTLVADGSNLYFVANDAAKAKIKAVSLDELLQGVAAEMFNSSAATAPAEPAGPGVQELWNGWYFGCIDLSGCTGQWADLNGETYDAVMYVELGGDGKGRLAIWDPFGKLISNEHSNKYVDAVCHADAQYLYADSGEVFGCEIDPSDWVFVHNLSIPEKLNVGSASTNDAGETVGYDFQFKPWGDRWEGDDYAQFIPYFDAYLDGVDAGLTSPFGDTFSGFGIAQPASGGESAPPVSGSAPSGGRSDLLGANPAKLDVNDRGIVNLYYPADQFVYDDLYGKLKNENTGVGILLDPMLGATNLEELRQSYQENNSDEDDYSLTEITVNGYKALLLKYSDFLGATMRVDVDFGGNHDGWYGISFAVSGDSLADCDADLVWAIIESMELLK